MQDMVKGIKVEQQARKVGEMGSGVTGQEVKDIVRREVINAHDGRNVSMTPQPSSQLNTLNLK